MNMRRLLFRFFKVVWNLLSWSLNLFYDEIFFLNFWLGKFLIDFVMDLGKIVIIYFQYHLKYKNQENIVQFLKEVYFFNRTYKHTMILRVISTILPILPIILPNFIISSKGSKICVSNTNSKTKDCFEKDQFSYDPNSKNIYLEDSDLCLLRNISSLGEGSQIYLEDCQETVVKGGLFGPNRRTKKIFDI